MPGPAFPPPGDIKFPPKPGGIKPLVLPRRPSPLQRAQEASQATAEARKSINTIMSQSRPPWGGTPTLSGSQVESLEKALRALLPWSAHRQGQLWCVFGCGGDRDAGKRPQMGRVAQEFADQIVITSDNPRSEEPTAIIKMIQAGMTTDEKQIQVVSDRAAAIMAAVRHADIADVILVAGKGHEATQEIKGKKFDFSDQEHIRLAAGGGI